MFDSVLSVLGTCLTVSPFVQNALLAGPDERRVVSLTALTPCEYMVIDRALFNWFIGQYPHAILSFILTTTSRQWRVAYVTLVEILGIPGAFSTSVESSDPAFPDMALSKDAIVAASSGVATFVSDAESSLHFSYSGVVLLIECRTLAQRYLSKVTRQTASM